MRIPSLGDDAKMPARAKVDSYPVQERYGIVFAFLGDLPESERPPLYDIEEYGTPEWKSQLYVLKLGAYYERSMENGLDPIHNEFVHPMQGAPLLTPELQRVPVPVRRHPLGQQVLHALRPEARSQHGARQGQDRRSRRRRRLLAPGSRTSS